MNTPSCCGSCRQGREKCLTPSACHLPEPSTLQRINLFALLVWLTAMLTIAFLGAFLIGVGYAVWPVLVAALS